MFDSPLQYCTSCKQYVELDQTAEECAQQNGCKREACPVARLFKPPTSDTEKVTAQPLTSRCSDTDGR